MCRRKKHSNSTEIYWCYEVYSYWSGCVTRKTCSWLMECRFEQTFVRFLDRIHKVYSVQRETSKGIYVVRGETDQRFIRIPDQIMYGQKFGRNLVKPLRIEENRSEQKKNQSSGPHTQIWTCCKEIEKMIIGMWTRIEFYQFLGQESESSLYW